MLTLKQTYNLRANTHEDLKNREIQFAFKKVEST